MGSGLNLDLGCHPILGDPGDNPKETIAGRLFCWIVPTLLAGEFRGQPGEVSPVDVAPATRPQGYLEPARVGPPTHGIHTDP